MLAWGESVLAAAGVPTPRVDAEWLLADCLHLRRSELALHFPRILSHSQRMTFAECIERRHRRIPLQHILGTVTFHGLSLSVGPNVLIPRPETEELVEFLARFLEKSPPHSILDLGTGSGACIHALGSIFPAAQLTACDIDAAALSLARANAATHAMGARVHFFQSDWFANLRGKWDLIIANPPYLTEEEWAAAEEEVRAFEPRHALLSGGEGAEDLKKILAAAPNFLSANGLLAMEMGIAHGEILASRAASLGYPWTQIRRDLSHRDRFFLARWGNSP
jgi:release factor glutamine methyltransferase